MKARQQPMSGHMKYVPAVKNSWSEAPCQLTVVPPSGPEAVNFVETTPFS